MIKINDYYTPSFHATITIVLLSVSYLRQIYSSYHVHTTDAGKCFHVYIFQFLFMYTNVVIFLPTANHFSVKMIQPDKLLKIQKFYLVQQTFA